MTHGDWITASRILNSAATYLDLSWCLNEPADTRSFAEWWAADPVGRASAFLHWLAANSRDHLPTGAQLAALGGAK